MSGPIERVDHLVAVVEHFDKARRVWIDAGCPVVYDGGISTFRACCVSIGVVNLELLSAEAFDAWAALARWRARAGRPFGLQAIGLDPGDLDVAVPALRERGLDATAPREGGLAAAPGALPSPRWRISYVDDLAGLLPGLASFLCEFAPPHARLGRSLPESPVQLVELCLQCPDPEATVQSWQRGVGTEPVRDGSGYLVRLGDTPIRVTRGMGLTAVVKSCGDQSTDARLASAVPGVQIVPQADV